MKITRLELKNFKRFDDLTIDLTSVAEAPKLVLLIGTNGSGKSSVFDAFEILNKYTKENIPPHWNKPSHLKRLSSYYEKKANIPLIVNLSTSDGREFHNQSK